MKRMTVLYDGDCAVCVRAADWLRGAHQEVPLELLDARSLMATERFAAIPWLGGELVVVADDGRVWAGPAAFLITGWALRSYRGLAELGMSPILLPLSLGLFRWVSDHRGWLSEQLGGPSCESGQCQSHHSPVRAMLPAPYR